MTTSMAPGLLVSMPNLNDPYFQKTVILLCEYTDESAFGVVINRPSHLQVQDLLTGDQKLLDAIDVPFLVGGPVQPEFLWSVHTADFLGESTTVVGKGVHMSSAQEILISLSEGLGPQQYHLGFGYAGWGPGQLDNELKDGAWWGAPVNANLVLDVEYSQRWDKVMSDLGIDPMAANFGTTGLA